MSGWVTYVLLGYMCRVRLHFVQSNFVLILACVLCRVHMSGATYKPSPSSLNTKSETVFCQHGAVRIRV